MTEITLLYDIRNLLWQNTIATWSGTVVALVALVISIVALFKVIKNGH